MSPEEFSEACIDLLVIGPCCPMGDSFPEPYAVHRGSKTGRVYMRPSREMTCEQRVEQIAAIIDVHGYPTAAQLRSIHPAKNRAEQLISAGKVASENEAA